VVGSSRDIGEKYFMNEDIVLVTINYRLGALGETGRIQIIY
jgi:carboxylesterase type B